MTGPSGGFCLEVDAEEALKQAAQWVKNADLEGKVGFIIDCAANDFGNTNYQYDLTKFCHGKPKQIVSGQQLIDKYMNWVGTYQIIALQDPFFYQDMGNYQELMSKLAKKVQIIGCQ